MNNTNLVYRIKKVDGDKESFVLTLRGGIPECNNIGKLYQMKGMAEKAVTRLQNGPTKYATYSLHTYQLVEV